MRFKRLKWIVVGSLLVVILGGWAAGRFVPSRNVQSQLQAIRAAGLPASPADLDGWYVPVPERENQAAVIIKAGAAYVEPSKGLDPGNISAADDGRVAAYLGSNAPALKLLHEAAELKESRYPINLAAGFATLLPHLAKVKAMVQLLRMEAVYQSQLGNAEEAIRSLNTGFRAADSLRNEPLLISELVRIAGVSIMLGGLEQILSRHQLTKEQLEELSQRVAEAELSGPRSLYRAWVGERACGMDAFRMSFAQLDQMGGSGTSNPNGLEGLGYQVYRASGLRARDMSLYLEMMEAFARSSKLEFPAALEQAEKVEADMQERFSHGLTRFAIISRMLLPSLGKATRKEATIASRLRCAQVALAIERFRLNHNGSIPEGLEQLVPEYLFKVPVDAIDGSALEYKKLETKGYEVISRPASAERKSVTKGGEPVGTTVSR